MIQRSSLGPRYRLSMPIGYSCPLPYVDGDSFEQVEFLTVIFALVA